MINRASISILSLYAIATLVPVEGFSTLSRRTQAPPIAAKTSTSIHMKESCNNEISFSRLVSTILSVGVIGSSLLMPGNALADEIGRETEAPTLFTGETVMICTKRGPLGACTKSVSRTAENDNDKASKYFRDPQAGMKEKYSAAQLQSIGDGDTAKIVMASDGNELIEKLRQQSVDNKDKNDKIVRAKTLQNDMGASFGPLDSQVAILNSDGETFSLLKGAQAMRLKKSGYIKDRRFVTQPTKEVIEAALEADESSPGAFLGGVVKNVFGSSDE